ncbi:hydroxyproline-rich glycoprotein family protein [Thalictrum thalictroides]|uniref:Hydroxyproline-rich glycoprotein family protein n=1 Tax=Thalictrum thalictroides TaxID=46969 RepID=A0A7J6XFQ6_THATH|nr:hydroxyproline-rich glycoprotein family protein [Thalictrum thalictroides]
MEEDGQTTPFWLQSSTYFQSSNHHNPHRRRQLSSVCLNSGFLIVVLSIVGLITIFFVIPSFLSFTSQVFKPNLVKKSWDNLNLVLVLFAIFCGILGRKRDDGESNGDVGIDSNATPVSEEPLQQPVQQQQQQWYGYSDQGIHEHNSNMVGSLKRNSSSYPDLRQESSWVSSDDQNWRFFDDNYVYNQRLGSSSVYRRKQRQQEEEDVAQDLGVKTIPVDRYVVSQQELSSPPPLPASPPTLSPPRQSTPPPPPPPPLRPTSEKKHKARQTFQSVPHKEHSESKEVEFKKKESPTRQPSPPPQSPPEMSTTRSEKKAKKHERKKTPPSEFSRPRKPMTPGRPPLPSKINSFYDESLNTGNQSPLVPMPPPPPPPPFKMPGFKFVVRGDYVRLQSSHSSRSNSPDLDFTDTPPTSTPVTPTTMDGGEAGVSVFCPSPDVNTKADTFIARFKAGLRMEKVNSFKEKQELSTSDPSPRSKPSLS